MTPQLVPVGGISPPPGLPGTGAEGVPGSVGREGSQAMTGPKPAGPTTLAIEPDPPPCCAPQQQPSTAYSAATATATMAIQVPSLTLINTTLSRQH